MGSRGNTWVLSASVIEIFVFYCNPFSIECGMHSPGETITANENPVWLLSVARPTWCSVPGGVVPGAIDVPLPLISKSSLLQGE